MCQQCKSIPFRKRFFADFMAKDDDISYQQYKDKKETLFQNLRGKVVEIGAGTGVNLRFFPKEIEWVGIEPNEAMHPYLENEAERQGISIELRKGNAEQMDMENESVDFVVSTIVLCSVKNVKKTLQEIKRILKPGGKFIFLEHQADESWTFRRVVQTIVPYTPWRYFSDGCTPSRQLGKAIENAGFEKVVYKKYMQEGAGLILAVNRPHLYGWAQKSKI